MCPCKQSISSMQNGQVCGQSGRLLVHRASAHSEAQRCARTTAMPTHNDIPAHRGLMSQEDLDSLGFSQERSVDPGKVGGHTQDTKPDKEIVAGLTAARKRKPGLMFGWGSDKDSS